MTNSTYADRPCRSQFSVAIMCSGCGHAGFARWEENDIHENGPQRTLVGLSGGFQHEPKRPRQSGDPAIHCRHCNTLLAD